MATSSHNGEFLENIVENIWAWFSARQSECFSDSLPNRFAEGGDPCSSTDPTGPRIWSAIHVPAIRNDAALRSTGRDWGKLPLKGICATQDAVNAMLK